MLRRYAGSSRSAWRHEQWTRASPLLLALIALGLVLGYGVRMLQGDRWSVGPSEQQQQQQQQQQGRPGYSLRKICSQCAKPNALVKDFCTGCGAPLSADDVREVPDNPFMEVIAGVRDPETVRWRDSELLVFADKFPASHTLHLQIIPLSPAIGDITALRAEHVPLLQRMYASGKAVAMRESTELMRVRDELGMPLEDLIFAGFNLPVSVQHLHLHLIAVPFRHEKIFDKGGPRWHPLHKVLADLQAFGHVRTYHDVPQAAETHSYWQQAINLSRLAQKSLGAGKASN